MYSTIKKKQYNARNTVLEMLQDRGYEVPKEQFEFTYKDFLEIGFQNIYISNPEGTKWVYVFFSKQEKAFTITNLKETYAEILEETDNINVHIILMLNEEPNSSVKTELSGSKYTGVEYFKYSDLEMNITKHEIMPRYEEMKDKEEIERVLKLYNARKQELPKILSTDPLAKYYNAKPGTMFRTFIKSPSVGETVEYRLVR